MKLLVLCSIILEDSGHTDDYYHWREIGLPEGESGGIKRQFLEQKVLNKIPNKINNLYS